MSVCAGSCLCVYVCVCISVNQVCFQQLYNVFYIIIIIIIIVIMQLVLLYARTHQRTHTHSHTQTRAHATHTHTHTHTLVHTNIDIYTYTYTHMHTHTHILTYTHTYSHIYTVTFEMWMWLKKNNYSQIACITWLSFSSVARSPAPSPSAHPPIERRAWQTHQYTRPVRHTYRPPQTSPATEPSAGRITDNVRQRTCVGRWTRPLQNQLHPSGDKPDSDAI